MINSMNYTQTVEHIIKPNGEYVLITMLLFICVAVIIRCNCSSL